MKKYQFILAALLAIAACQKNEVAPETIDDEPVWGYVTAEVSTTAVKGVLVDGEEENTLDFKWEVGDKIRMAVNKGTLETPNYAWRNGYIYSINEGEHTVTIKYDKGTGVNIANYIVGAWYPWLDKENSEPTAIRTTQDYSTGKVSIPLHATNVSTENPIDVGPAAGADAELAQKLVFGPYNPGGTAYSVLGFRLTKGNADRTIKSIKVNNGSRDYTLTNINTALTNDVQYFYIVLPASSTPISDFKATIVANDGANDLEYTRTKASYTPQAGTVTLFPKISDLDETGKHIWRFGTTADNTSETPLEYWIQAHRWMQTDKIVAQDGYAKVETHPANSDHDTKKQLFRADIAPIYNWNYCTNGVDRLTKNDGTVYLDIHTGNYPIFAVKMTNPNNLGDIKRNFSIMMTDVDAEYDSKKFFNADNRQEYLSPSTSSTKGVVVMYFDLSSASLVVGDKRKILANTKAYRLKRFNIQFADISYSSSQSENPTFDIYWAGFFNSVDDELTKFAENN